MSYLCETSDSTLIVIDIQQRLMPVIHEGAEVVKRAAIMAHAAKLLDIPIVGTVQNRTRLGDNVADIHPLLDKVIEKNDFDACAVAEFLASLDPQRKDLIVVGCEAHVCVLQTVLGLLERKWRVRLLVDAIGSRQPLSKTTAIERARSAGAEILTTEMVLFEWMRNSDHPGFKQILNLIK
jgi:nicotinamidase-related amidase